MDTMSDRYSYEELKLKYPTIESMNKGCRIHINLGKSCVEESDDMPCFCEVLGYLHNEHWKYGYYVK